MEDSIYPLPLPGWEDLSTWGGDTGMGSLYAQLTRNGSSDDDGPDIWITPPQYPAVENLEQLARLIAEATGVDQETVATAMRRGIEFAGPGGQRAGR